jgi:hypothetical protein
MRKSKADDLSGWITEISEDPTQRMTRLEADLRAIAASFDALAEELEGIDAEAAEEEPEMVTGPGLGSA